MPVTASMPWPAMSPTTNSRSPSGNWSASYQSPATSDPAMARHRTAMSTPAVSNRCTSTGMIARCSRSARLVLLGRALLAVREQVASGGEGHPGAHVVERLRHGRRRWPGRAR